LESTSLRVVLRYAAAQLTSGFHIANMPSTEHNQPALGANDFLVRIVSVLISSLSDWVTAFGNSLKDRNVSRSERGSAVGALGALARPT
jgi:hypothetical protein